MNISIKNTSMGHFLWIPNSGIYCSHFTHDNNCCFSHIVKGNYLWLLKSHIFSSIFYRYAICQRNNSARYPRVYGKQLSITYRIQCRDFPFLLINSGSKLILYIWIFLTPVRYFSSYFFCNSFFSPCDKLSYVPPPPPKINICSNQNFRLRHRILLQYLWRNYRNCSYLHLIHQCFLYCWNYKQ